jgi:hypothetical protein
MGTKSSAIERRWRGSALSKQLQPHGWRLGLAVLIAAFTSVILIGPTRTAAAVSTDCNAVVSMSQGRQVYNGTSGSGRTAFSPLEPATGEEWMLMFKSGKALPWWTNPANWTGLGIQHSCGTNAEVDAVVFIFDPFRTTDMGADLATVLTIIRDRFPSATAHLILMVGSEGHVICERLNARGQLVPVHAALMHASYIGQMTMPEAGPDIDVPCSEYSSTSGSLTNAGAASANADLAAWFVGING